jgi:hypothetical protein
VSLASRTRFKFRPRSVSLREDQLGRVRAPVSRTALDSDLYARERWYAADRPAIGADPAVILATE